MVRAVTEGREGVQADLLLPAGLGCPHDYAVTPQDMRKLAEADILVINGLGLEEFLVPPLRQAHLALRTIDSSAAIAPLVNGLFGFANSGYSAGMNPHSFASPRLASDMVNAIAHGLAEIDPEGAALYQANAERYRAELDILADEIGKLGASLGHPRVAAPYEVFDYFIRDAGLAFAVTLQAHDGLEGSAAAMLSAIARVSGEHVAAILAEPRQAERMLRVSQETGVPLVVLDPVDSGPDGAGPEYYLMTMRHNLAALERTFGTKP
jgi:ABC-type Zn uptake system ZnuABC Zn-binding protein ZnuA